MFSNSFSFIPTSYFPRICAQMLLVHSEDKVDLEKLHNSSNENSNEYRRLSGFGQKYDANDNEHENENDV